MRQAQTGQFNTELGDQCFRGSLLGVTKALDAGADANYNNGEPLRLVIDGQAPDIAKEKVIQLLKGHGANLSLRDSIALTWAVRQNSTELFDCLLEQGVPLPVDADMIIVEAIHFKNAPILEFILRRGKRLSADMREVLSPEREAYLKSAEEKVGLAEPAHHEALSPEGIMSASAETEKKSPSAEAHSSCPKTSKTATLELSDVATTPQVDADSALQGSIRQSIVDFVFDIKFALEEKLVLLRVYIDEILEDVAPAHASKKDEAWLDLLLAMVDDGQSLQTQMTLGKHFGSSPGFPGGSGGSGDCADASESESSSGIGIAGRNSTASLTSGTSI